MKAPQHIAFIPDGNRTLAKERGLDKFIGHLEGFRRMMELAIHIFTKSETKVFTLWWLSTENLKNRSQEELEYLFVLYEEITQQLYDTLHKEQVNFWVAGNIDQLPDHLKNRLLAKQKEYRYPTDRWFVLAINYWGQDEILRGIKSLISSGESITQDNLEKHMDFGHLPKVDLVIRTKQQYAKRLSGFMLWWIGYAQLYFSDLFCPDFTVEELEKAIAWYNDSTATQNFGK